MLRLTVWLLPVLAALAPTMAVVDCDCTITPYSPEPPCFRTCTARLLATLRPSQVGSLAKLAKLPSELLADAVRAAQRKSITSLAELESELGARRYRRLETRLRTAVEGEQGAHIAALSSPPPDHPHRPVGIGQGEMLAADSRLKLRLTSTIEEELSNRFRIDPSDIGVDVTNGIVTLTGQVHSRDEKQEIERIALNTRGVRLVRSRLRPADSDGWTTEANPSEDEPPG